MPQASQWNHEYEPPAGYGWKRQLYISLKGVVDWPEGPQVQDYYFEKVYVALLRVCPIERPSDRSEEIAGATVIGQIGRMAICRMYCEGDSRMSLIITPAKEVQGWVWALENRYWEPMAETPFVKTLKRAIDRGGLLGEMDKVEKKILGAIFKAGFIDAVRYRDTGRTTKSVAEVAAGRDVLRRLAPELLMVA